MWVKANLYKITYKRKDNFENVLMASYSIEEVIKDFKKAIADIKNIKNESINITNVEQLNYTFYKDNDIFTI